MNYGGHNTAYISACAAFLLGMVCLLSQCFSESRVLSFSIDLGGAVEDADIAPHGDYTAAAVRKCGMQ